MSEIPLFDKDDAMARVDGDVDLLKELVVLCNEDFHEKLPQIRHAIAQGDAKRVGELAHSMKSAFGNLGAMRAFDAARALERAGKDAQLAELPVRTDSFEKECREFLAFFAEQYGVTL